MTILFSHQSSFPDEFFEFLRKKHHWCLCKFLFPLLWYVINTSNATTGLWFSGHCQKLHPIWTKLAERHDREDSVDIVEVDCIRNSDLCDAHGILGYPTMKFFQVGSTEGKEFEGRRDVTSLENFMEQCNSEAFS